MISSLPMDLEMSWPVIGVYWTFPQWMSEEKCIHRCEELTVATRELLTVKKAWQVWKREWLVLSLSSKWSLSLFHIPKYLCLIPDIIPSPHCSRCSFSTHTYNLDFLFIILYVFAFLLSESWSLFKQWVHQFTQRCDSKGRSRPFPISLILVEEPAL